MIDFHTELVKTLNSILPTHYEMTLTSNTATPCISYMELSNVVQSNGDTIGYSRVQYQVKVWSNKIADLQKYAKEIDTALRAIGFTRVACRELYDYQSTMTQKIMTYEALALEEF